MDAAERYFQAEDARLDAEIRAWPGEPSDADDLLAASEAAWYQLSSEEIDRINAEEDGRVLVTEYRHLSVEVRGATDRRSPHQFVSCHVLRALLWRMRTIWDQAPADSRGLLLGPRGATWPWADALALVEERIAANPNAGLPRPADPESGHRGPG